VPPRSLVPERLPRAPVVEAIPEESFESLNVDALFSESEAPPAGEERHSIPAFSRNITPRPAPHPLSDPEIRVSIDEDDTI
jgi:hypothetical protein